MSSPMMIRRRAMLNDTDVSKAAKKLLGEVDAEIARLQELERGVSKREAEVAAREKEVEKKWAELAEEQEACNALRGSLERKIAVVHSRRLAQDAEHKARMDNLGST